jgi:hypothetical protein
VEARIDTFRPAIAVAEEARDRIEGAGLEVAAQDVHRTNVMGQTREV